MPDEFDQELDRGPEGSIITPILLGCGAMGLGCVFSLGAIAIAVMIFLPGIWTLINQLDDDPMMAETFVYVEANEQVIAAVGLPMEAEYDDLDDGGNDETSYTLGDEINFISSYTVRGPIGSARVVAEGSKVIINDEAWNITSVVVTLDGGREVRVYPPEVEAPPPPVSLAPPEAPARLDESTEDMIAKPSKD